MKYCPKCKTEYEDWVKLCADCEVTLVNHLPKEVVTDKQGQNLVTVYTHIIESSIELVKTALESEGIKCFVKGVDRMRASLSFGTGLELQVPEKDRTRAEKIIKELNAK